MIPPTEDAAPEQAAVPTLTPAPGVQRILDLARQKQEATGQNELGLYHLVGVLAETYTLMVRDLAPLVDTDTLQEEMRQHLEGGASGPAIDFDALLLQAGQRTQARGKTTISERDVAATILALAGYWIAGDGPNETVPPGTALPQGGNTVTQRPRRRYPNLERYGQDLVEAAQEGRLAPFVGRESEVQMVIETLCRRITRNPVLVGPAGVGKTAIVEGLAYRIAAGNVPDLLKEARLFVIMPSAITAGASQYGELEKRLETVIEEARDPSVLLFIDEVHAIVGAGGRPGSNDIATLLKPALARGEVACIAATTDDEYRRFIEQDPALERRFQPIRVNELGMEATLQILRELRRVSAEARGVSVSEEALRYLVELAGRYLRNRHFPAKGVDLFEQCIAHAIAHGKTVVDSDDADTVVRRLVGMPALPQERLQGLRERLVSAPGAAEVLSLSDAEALVNRLQVSLEGFDLRPERANVTLLLAGRAAAQGASLAREISDGLFGAPDRVITIDFGRFTETHHVSMLLGSPPGYIGYSERLPIHGLEQTPWCVLLCENVDQCHPSLRTVLARALEVGEFTDASGKNLYVSDAVVILTARTLEDGGPAGGSNYRRSGFLEIYRRTRAESGTPVTINTLRAEAERVLGADLADHCDLICTTAADGNAEARRRIEQSLLRPIAARYAQDGMVLTWEPAVVDYLISLEPGQTSPRDQERILDRHIAPLLLPFRREPGRGSAPRHLILQLDNGRLTATEDSKETETE